MDHSKIVGFIWGIADDCLRDVYVRGKYRDVILPMTVIRRLDAVLEDTKTEVLRIQEIYNNKILLNNKIDPADELLHIEDLKKASQHAFYNSSPFTLKDLGSKTKRQTLEADFVTYLDGFSQDIQEILEKFKFRVQIQTMVEADILGAVIEKFINPQINLSPYPVKEENGEIKHLALDNHSMGVIFEELIRKFNEENNEEAGEHFTPRDIVELMADLIFIPIQDIIVNKTFSCYDGACGTGGMLTVAEQHLLKLMAQKFPKEKPPNIHLFGQEISPETYAITKADLLIKGDIVDHIHHGSTISNDKLPDGKFDFMLSNPPFGKSWKVEAERMGGKKDIIDPRFKGKLNSEISFIPKVSDGQMLFLANNISKMKETTEIGSRIAEVHNGSSLFTGDAGQGESNFRRYMIEKDLLEAIIALPENIFYNTGIPTYIWVLSNRKEDRRKDKVQLIDATSFKSSLRKNLGKRNCELTLEHREQILDLYTKFENNEYSKIFDGKEFGYYKIEVQHPQKDGKITKDTEKIPLLYEGGIDAFLKEEVLNHSPKAVINEKKTVIGYEISFTKYFYKAPQLRSLAEITKDLQALEKESTGILHDIIGE